MQTAVPMMVCGGVLGAALLDRTTFHTWRDFGVMLGPVASASLLFIAASLFAPSLVPSGRLVWPQNLTLPVVFAMLVRVSVILWASPPNAIFQPLDPLRPALVWTQPFALFLLFACESAFLTVMMQVRRTPV